MNSSQAKREATARSALRAPPGMSAGTTEVIATPEREGGAATDRRSNETPRQTPTRQEFIEPPLERTKDVSLSNATKRSDELTRHGPAPQQKRPVVRVIAELREDVPGCGADVQAAEV